MPGWDNIQGDGTLWHWTSSIYYLRHTSWRGGGGGRYLRRHCHPSGRNGVWWRRDDVLVLLMRFTALAMQRFAGLLALCRVPLAIYVGLLPVEPVRINENHYGIFCLPACLPPLLHMGVVFSLCGSLDCNTIASMPPPFYP